MWRRRTETQLLFEGAAHPAGGSGALLDERVIAVASLSIVHGTAKRPPESQARGGACREAGHTLAMRAIATVDQERQRRRQSSQPCAEAAWRVRIASVTQSQTLVSRLGRADWVCYSC